MDAFAAIADERRGLADLIEGLSPQQLATPSLCDGWTVHDVAAHLIMPLEVSTPAIVLAVLASGGSFDRANARMTRRLARRPIGEIVEVLRRKADTRFTPPGAGPGAPLTDVLVHGLDVRVPLGLARDLPEGRLLGALEFLTSRAGRGLVPRGVVGTLRFEATDVDWAHGSGPVVRGGAESLLLALTGRRVGLGSLAGAGLPTLRALLS